jgi:hypothetical protein
LQQSGFKLKKITYFFLLMVKQDIIDTSNPTNEIINPNPDVVPLDSIEKAIPKIIIAIPNSINRIGHPPQLFSLPLSTN